MILGTQLDSSTSSDRCPAIAKLQLGSALQEHPPISAASHWPTPRLIRSRPIQTLRRHRARHRQQLPSPPKAQLSLPQRNSQSYSDSVSPSPQSSNAPILQGRRRRRPSPAMAAVASTSAVASPCLLHRPLAAPAALRAAARPVSGLPALRMPKIACSAERKEAAKTEEVNGLPQLAAAVTSAATMAYAHPVFALVDDRLSGEGTGLGLGVSNPKLTWILVGVTALIWVLYFTYSSKLPEGDDDSGLDL